MSIKFIKFKILKRNKDEQISSPKRFFRGERSAHKIIILLQLQLC